MDPVFNDFDSVWHSVGGGALVAAALTVLRLGLEYTQRRGERRLDHEERRRSHQRQARLERVLQERLGDADRRAERCEAEMRAERGRRVALESDYAVLSQAHAAMRDQLATLQTEHAVLIGQQRLLLGEGQGLLARALASGRKSSR
jgi:hypothetical protein